MNQRAKSIYHNTIATEKVLKHLLKKHSLLSDNRLPGHYKAISPRTLRYLEYLNFMNMCNIAKMLHIEPSMSDARTSKEQWELNLDKYFLTHDCNATITANHFNKTKDYYNRTFVSEGTVINNHYKLFKMGKSISIFKWELHQVAQLLLNNKKHIYPENYSVFERKLTKIINVSKSSLGRYLKVLIRNKLIIVKSNKIIIDLPRLELYKHNINLYESHDR